MAGADFAVFLSNSAVCALGTQAGPRGWIEADVEMQPMQRHSLDACICSMLQRDHFHFSLLRCVDNC